jgi:uncharacterized membrane-anchored protein YjiN (DUF445 family)
MGLPIPHTALVPRKKVELATKLGEFVTEHFLTSDLLAEQVRAQRLVATSGSWLATPANASRLATEASSLIAAGLSAMDERNIADYLIELVRRDATRRSYAPIAGRLLRRALAGDVQRPLVDVVVSRGHDYLLEHRAQAIELLRSYIDKQKFLVRTFTPSSWIEQAVDSAIETLSEVSDDPRHPLRAQLDGLLEAYAETLESSYELAARLNSAVLAGLKDPRLAAILAELVGDTVTSIRESLSGAHGDLQDRIAALLIDLGNRAASDVEFQARAEASIVRLLDLGVTRYGSQLTSLIRTQVGKWSDDEVSERIELAVGRDLQFIRINGTAVGALAGILIHAVSVLL